MLVYQRVDPSILPWVLKNPNLRCLPLRALLDGMPRKSMEKQAELRQEGNSLWLLNI